jgi:PilZ domain
MQDRIARPLFNDQGELRLIERRAEERFQCVWRPVVGFIARAKSLYTNRATICNISSLGIGMIVDSVLEPGTIIAIQLRKKRNGFSGLLSARVVRAVPEEDGSFFVGCRLSRRLSQEELEAFGLK